MSSTVEPPVALPYPAYPAAAYAVAPHPGRVSGFMLRMWRRSPTWTGPAAIAMCFASAAAVTMAIHPVQQDAYATPSCLIKMTTGFDCPGCGGTRAFWYTVHGDLPAAARHHALFVFALPFLLYMYVAWSVKLVFKRQLPQLRLSPLAVGLFLTAWAVFSVARNLPWAPFTRLYV